ncbi:MAG: ABC transporter permease subunit [Tissierellia bacterium]|jgi:phosphate transport system permease protein|nr:ABC transporter permease subunit [Tissierellia bacterium]
MNEKTKSFLFKGWILLSTLIVLAIVFYIFGYILSNGIESINMEFLLDGPSGIPVGSQGGIFPAIVGSLLLMLISCVFASILAISTSIYLVFYCESERIKGLIHLITQCMSGVPSIILGLFGYTFLVLYLNLGRSVLAGGLTLGFMIYPFIQVRVEKTLLEVDKSIINSSYALGISRTYTLFKLILPICKSDIVSAITLAGGFAMGAASPIILTAAVTFAPIPSSLSSPVMALPFHLYILTGEGISLEKAYGTALVLILLLLIINIISTIINITRKEHK